MTGCLEIFSMKSAENPGGFGRHWMNELPSSIFYHAPHEAPYLQEASRHFVSCGETALNIGHASRLMLGRTFLSDGLKMPNSQAEPKMQIDSSHSRSCRCPACCVTKKTRPTSLAMWIAQSSQHPLRWRTELWIISAEGKLDSCGVGTGYKVFLFLFSLYLSLQVSHRNEK